VGKGNRFQDGLSPHAVVRPQRGQEHGSEPLQVLRKNDWAGE
jgi:hypothetical protein